MVHIVFEKGVQKLFECNQNDAESHPADFPAPGFRETMSTGIRSSALFCLHSKIFKPTLPTIGAVTKNQAVSGQCH